MSKQIKPWIEKPNMSDTFRYFGKHVKNYWEKYGGRICTVAGTTGLFFTGVHTSRKTYKIHDELVDNGMKILEAKEPRYGEKKYQRWLRVAKTELICGLKTSKHYIPDMVAGGLSAYSIHKGWSKEHKHYEQSAAVVGVLAADFMNYRQNVISEHGKDADRRYLTTKHGDFEEKLASTTDGTTISAVKDENGETKGLLVSVDPNMFRIKYSRETTPSVWSDSHALRLTNLKWIVSNLERQLIYGGSYSVNDVRREFYGKRGDVGAGGMFGRVFEPGNEEHPEYGAMVNLHYEDDEDFMSGRKDWCWIIIDVDDEPLFERMSNIRDKEQRFPTVEDT